jgi:F-type H+-transporting ATPase subunit a
VKELLINTQNENIFDIENKISNEFSFLNNFFFFRFFNLLRIAKRRQIKLEDIKQFNNSINVDNQIKDNLGTVYQRFAPYMVFLYAYIPIAFVIGLLGLPSPMTYFTIPLCLGLVTWIGIQVSAIYYQKLDYLKGFTSPLPTWMPVFVPINILSKFAPLLSLSMRLFGNAISGYILMFLVYWATGLASEAVVGIAGLNIFGVILAPVLHAYFDAFSAFVQTVIFTTLTMLLIATEVPVPVDVDLNKKSKRQLRKEKRALKKA